MILVMICSRTALMSLLAVSLPVGSLSCMPQTGVTPTVPKQAKPQGASSRRATRHPEVAILQLKGAWSPEATHTLPSLLKALRLSFDTLGPADLAAGKLLSKGKPAYRLLIAPGGWAPTMIDSLGGWAEGSGKPARALKRYLEKGGRYLGFCAGAFLVSRSVKWGDKSYRYPLGFFPGEAQGPLPWNPSRKEGLGATHGHAVLNLKHPCFRGSLLPKLVRPLLFGGPRFVLPKSRRKSRGIEVLARHGEDSSVAILAVPFGKKGGRLVLCSFHPSVLTDDQGKIDGDKTRLSQEGAKKDPDGSKADWLLAQCLVRYAAGLPRKTRKAKATRKAK